jgi:hypothetical protein
MPTQRTPDAKTAGFSLIELSIGTLIVVLLVGLANFSGIADYVTARATAPEFAAHLKDAQQWMVGMDVHRPIRLAAENGYVVERRDGAGWLLETTYRLPEGFGTPAPETAELFARGNCGFATAERC